MHKKLLFFAFISRLNMMASISTLLAEGLAALSFNSSKESVLSLASLTSKIIVPVALASSRPQVVAQY